METRISYWPSSRELTNRTLFTSGELFWFALSPPWSCISYRVLLIFVGDFWTIAQRTRMRTCPGWRRTLFPTWAWLRWGGEPWRPPQRDACKLNKTPRLETPIGVGRRAPRRLPERHGGRELRQPCPISVYSQWSSLLQTIIKKYCKRSPLGWIGLPKKKKKGGTVVNGFCITDSRVFGILYKLMGASPEMSGCIALYSRATHRIALVGSRFLPWLGPAVKNEHALHSEESFNERGATVSFIEKLFGSLVFLLSDFLFTLFLANGGKATYSESSETHPMYLRDATSFSCELSEK